MTFHTAHAKISDSSSADSSSSLIFLVPLGGAWLHVGTLAVGEENGSPEPHHIWISRRPFRSYGGARHRFVIVSRPHVVVVRIGLPLVFTLEKILSYDVLAVDRGSSTQVRPLCTFCPCRYRSLDGLTAPAEQDKAAICT